MNLPMKTDTAPRPLPTAAALYEQAWSKPRTPRSPEYKDGVLGLLRYQLRETAGCRNPYKPGTAEADAFWAGVDEGWQILRNHGAATRSAQR